MSAKPNQCYICKTILLSRVGLLKHIRTQHGVDECTAEVMLDEDSTEISSSSSGSADSENKNIEGESTGSESIISIPPPPELIEIASSSSEDAIEAAAAEPPEQYVCEPCNHFFESQSQLDDHLERYHGRDSDSPEVPDMPIRRTNKATAVAHNRPDIVFPCYICDQVFRTRLQLNDHLRDFHDLRSFLCIYCDDEYFSEDDLCGHETMVHRLKVIYKCDICLKRFVTDAGLHQHRCIPEQP